MKYLKKCFKNHIENINNRKTKINKAIFIVRYAKCTANKARTRY